MHYWGMVFLVLDDDVDDAGDDDAVFYVDVFDLF